VKAWISGLWAPRRVRVDSTAPRGGWGRAAGSASSHRATRRAPAARERRASAGRPTDERF